MSTANRSISLAVFYVDIHGGAVSATARQMLPGYTVGRNGFTAHSRSHTK